MSQQLSRIQRFAATNSNNHIGLLLCGCPV
jgi:hypothetical protein